jgi:hypothetical protein
LIDSQEAISRLPLRSDCGRQQERIGDRPN